MLPDILNVGAANNDAATKTIQQRHATDAHPVAGRHATEAQQRPGVARAYADQQSGIRTPGTSGDTKASGRAVKDQDQAHLDFALSQEEKLAFSRYLEDKDNGENVEETLPEDSQNVMKTAAERITKAIDETIARNTESRERVEKAVSEWYNSLSRGESDGERPRNFIEILRAVAMGKFDT